MPHSQIEKAIPSHLHGTILTSTNLQGLRISILTCFCLKLEELIKKCTKMPPSLHTYIHPLPPPRCRSLAVEQSQSYEPNFDQRQWPWDDEKSTMGVSHFQNFHGFFGRRIFVEFGILQWHTHKMTLSAFLKKSTISSIGFFPSWPARKMHLHAISEPMDTPSSPELLQPEIFLKTT